MGQSSLPYVVVMAALALPILGWLFALLDPIAAGIMSTDAVATGGSTHVQESRRYARDLWQFAPFVLFLGYSIKVLIVSRRRA